MIFQAKKVKEIVYFYLVENKKMNGLPIKDFEKCLGNHKKVDFLFQRYLGLKKRLNIK